MHSDHKNSLWEQGVQGAKWQRSIRLNHVSQIMDKNEEVYLLGLQHLNNLKRMRLTNNVAKMSLDDIMFKLEKLNSLLSEAS